MTTGQVRSGTNNVYPQPIRMQNTVLVTCIKKKNSHFQSANILIEYTDVQIFELGTTKIMKTKYGIFNHKNQQVSNIM